MTTARYPILACGHCGEGYTREQMAPCPFQPTKHLLCDACWGPTQATYAHCVKPKAAEKRKAVAG